VPELPRTTVTGDPTLLRQLFMILLENGIKFTPPGGKVAVRIERNRTRTHVTIADNGAGIPANALPHVFERFFRADPARSRGGTGLGLPIARWIVESHKGRIQVQSTEGKGTMVRVTLPS
jgi:signal transduction histidine kinase